ncbi:hypothetical protein AAE478_006493 [Parahypoxylon ruwenzoriense]
MSCVGCLKFDWREDAADWYRIHPRLEKSSVGFVREIGKILPARLNTDEKSGPASDLGEME